MKHPNFTDFMIEGGHYLLFPKDFGDYECTGCGHIIAPGDRIERVEWADEHRNMIKCPHCGREIEMC